MTSVRVLVLSVSVSVATLAGTGAAFADDPLMGKAPWSFTPQNRAAIAVAIKGIEDGSNGSGSGAGTIVCGGTSGASGEGATGSGADSKGNTSCIIVNNSDGVTITNPQYNSGNISSDSDASSKTTNKTKSGGSIDEVAAILSGPKQGR